MSIKRVMALAMVAVMLGAGALFGQERPVADPEKKAEKPRAEISGLMYLWWMGDLTSNSNANGFSIKRAYLNFQNRIDDIWSFRVTTDVNSNSIGHNGKDADMSAGDYVYLKFAYVQTNFKFDDYGIKVQYGISGTPVVDQIDRISGARWIYNNYIDKSKDLIGETYDYSADLGIKVDLSYLKLLTLTGMYANGAGFVNPNASEYSPTKAGYVMLTITPIETIYIAGYFKRQEIADTSIEKNNKMYTGAMAAWSDKSIKVGLNYAWLQKKEDGDTDTGSIIDIWANVNVNDFVGFPVLAYARFAYGEINSSKTYAQKYGVGYQFNSYVQAMILYEITNTKSDDTAANQGIYIKTEAKF
jgi:hypothetical protein